MFFLVQITSFLMDSFANTPPPVKLTRLFWFGFLGALGRLAPHGESVFQQPQTPALLPPGGAHLHHAGAPHHRVDVLVVQDPWVGHKQTTNTQQFFLHVDGNSDRKSSISGKLIYIFGHPDIQMGGAAAAEAALQCLPTLITFFPVFL